MTRSEATLGRTALEIISELTRGVVQNPSKARKRPRMWRGRLGDAFDRHYHNVDDPNGLRIIFANDPETLARLNRLADYSIRALDDLHARLEVLCGVEPFAKLDRERWRIVADWCDAWP